MTPEPEPAPQPVRKRVRRRKRIRRGAPRWVLPCVAACALIVIMIPVAHQLGWFRAQRGPGGSLTSAPVAPLVPDSALKDQAELLLSEATLEGEGAQRHIAGTVVNNTKSRFENVQVIFTLRDKAGITLGLATARLDKVESETKVRFKTDPVPERTFRHTLRDLSGTLK